MATGAIRGSRIGAGPMGEAERGEVAPRVAVVYYCANDHKTILQFASEAEFPEEWDCQSCGLPASLDAENRPDAPRTEPYKTHLAYVKERRTPAEAKAILNESLEMLRKKVRSGEIFLGDEHTPTKKKS